MEFHLPHTSFNDAVYILDKQTYEVFLLSVYGPVFVWSRCLCWAVSQQLPVAQIQYSPVALVLCEEWEIALYLAHALQGFRQVYLPKCVMIAPKKDLNFGWVSSSIDVPWWFLSFLFPPALAATALYLWSLPVLSVGCPPRLPATCPAPPPPPYPLSLGVAPPGLLLFPIFHWDGRSTAWMTFNLQMSFAVSSRSV